MACYLDGTPEETDPERIKINKIFADKNNKIKFNKKKQIS